MRQILTHNIKLNQKTVLAMGNALARPTTAKWDLQHAAVSDMRNFLTQLTLLVQETVLA